MVFKLINILLAGSIFIPTVFAKTPLQTQQIALLELYSSEGCSSCPPADRQIAKLRTHPKLWREFVPVNFHVDYWNRLGWNDRFSNKKFSNRQRQYSNEWNKEKVYTPAFVLNGEDVGPRYSNLTIDKTTSIRLQAKVSDQKVFIQVEGSKKPLVGHFAILANGLKTKVKSGENAGKTLSHEFVVVDLKEKIIDKDGEKIFTIPSIKLGQESLSYAFWLSPKGSQKPIQAIGGEL